MQELTITLTPQAWATMQADLCTLIGMPSMPTRSGMPSMSFSPLPGPTAEPPRACTGPGNRRATHMIHIAADCQIRLDGPGRAYYRRN